MYELPLDEHEPSDADGTPSPDTGCSAERERLINDIAFLVVREHRLHRHGKVKSDKNASSVFNEA